MIKEKKLKRYFLYILLPFLVLPMSSCGVEDIPSNSSDTLNEDHTHTFATTYSSDDSYHWYSATCCNEVQKKEEHTYGEWKVTQEPTNVFKGSKERTCSVCNHTQTQEIPRVEHSHTFSNQYIYDDTYHWYPTTCKHNEESEKAEHTYENEVCTVCGATYHSVGLEYQKYEDGYEVKSIGSCQDATIIIPSMYRGLPVVRIGRGAFDGSNLEDVQIPSSVTSIGYYAFNRCMNLSSIYIPDSVSVIEEGAFRNCEKLKEIRIPSSITTIERDAFPHFHLLNCTTYDNGYYLGNEDNPYVVFISCVSQENTSCDIHPKCKAIMDQAFYGSNIESITIPSEVCSILGGVFEQCSNLSTISVDEDNLVYDSRENCNGIIKTNTNTLVTGCKDTVIPSSVTSIGDFAFYGCINLSSIVLPASITEIGEHAFSMCSNLTSIIIPDGVKSIRYGTFSMCTKLESVTFPKELFTIDGFAFGFCTALSSITIPNKVENISQFAFSGCSNITSIVVEPENKRFDSRNNCNAIITKYSNEVILGCSTTVLPTGVTSIFERAFATSSIKSISIPDGVTKIWRAAFQDCKSLNTVYIAASVTTIESSAFSNCSSLVRIYYAGTLNEWKAISKEENWRANSNFILHCEDGEFEIDEIEKHS